VTFYLHHALAGPNCGHGGGQARRPAAQHEQLHGLIPNVEAYFGLRTDFDGIR
jgi:hypothetical protein